MNDTHFSHSPMASVEADQLISATQAEISRWHGIFLGVGAVGVLALLVANGVLARAVSVLILGTGCSGYVFGYGSKRSIAKLEDLRPLSPAEVHELASLATAHDGIREAVSQWLVSGATLRVQDLVAAQSFFARWDAATAQERAMAVLRDGISHG
jgi:hypothetical protein